MSTSYSQLQEYRSCPRRFGFSQLGYTSPSVNEPMTTGSLVHAGLAAYFKGQAVIAGIGEAIKETSLAVIAKLDGKDRWNAEEKLALAEKRAKELTTRYISHWAKDYRAVLVEPTLELDRVICHPDLIAYYGTPKEQRVLVDLKTSYHPDDRWYDMSNQTDLYAYAFLARLLNDDKFATNQATLEGSKYPHAIQLIIYDIISEEGIYRHMRPPRLAAGKHLFEGIQRLNTLIMSVENPHLPFSAFLSDPHPDYTCPSRCPYFTPCFLLETDTWETARDYMEENYLHGDV